MHKSLAHTAEAGDATEGSQKQQFATEDCTEFYMCYLHCVRF